MKKLPLLFAFAFLGLLLSACGGRQSSPAGVVKAFAAAIDKGDAKAAVALIEPSVTSQPQMQQKLESLVGLANSEIKKKGGIKSVEVTNVTVNGDSASVSVKYTYGNGSTDAETQDVVKVDGKWYLKMGQ